MRFLANENFPDAAIEALAAGGHDIVSVRRVAPGSPDRDELALAVRQRRVLLTFDKDFGELAASAALPDYCGVMLFRIPMPPPGEAGKRLADLVTTRNDWAGYFSVIEPGRVRMRPLVG